MIKRLFLGFILIVCAINSSAAEYVDSAMTRKIAPSIFRIGVSASFNLAFTEILKSSVHEMRPNRNDNHSWPSRHTSWTFTAASVLSHELYEHSAWWVIGAHTAANAVALQRTFSNNHFPKDVLGGAALGLVSTELGYCLSSLVFPETRRQLRPAEYDRFPGFEAGTTAIFPLSGIAGGTSVRTGCGSYLRFSLPCDDRWGLTASFSIISLPIFCNENYQSMLNSVGLSLGAASHWRLPDARWGAEARLMPGIAKNFGADGMSRPDWSFTLDASAAAICSVTSSFAIGAEAGYSLRTFNNVLNSITLSLLTRIRF